MGYLNPVEIHGYAAFAGRRAGRRGRVLLVDLPPEEAVEAAGLRCSGPGAGPAGVADHQPGACRQAAGPGPWLPLLRQLCRRDRRLRASGQRRRQRPPAGVARAPRCRWWRASASGRRQCRSLARQADGVVVGSALVAALAAGSAETRPSVRGRSSPRCGRRWTRSGNAGRWPASSVPTRAGAPASRHRAAPKRTSQHGFSGCPVAGRGARPGKRARLSALRPMGRLNGSVLPHELAQQVDAVRHPHRQHPSKKRSVPEGLWEKCSNCGSALYRPELEENLEVRPKCGHHMAILRACAPGDLFDADSTTEIGARLGPTDLLVFKDQKKYSERIKIAQKNTGEYDADRHARPAQGPCAGRLVVRLRLHGA